MAFLAIPALDADGQSSSEVACFTGRWGQGGRQMLPVLQMLDQSGNSLSDSHLPSTANALATPALDNSSQSFPETVWIMGRWGAGGRQALPVLQTLDLSGNSLTRLTAQSLRAKALARLCWQLLPFKPSVNLPLRLHGLRAGGAKEGGRRCQCCRRWN